MEDKNLFKELLFLSLGTVVISGNKAKELLKKLVENNKLTEEEGEKVMEHFISKSKEIRSDINEFAALVSEKTKIRKEEITELVREIMGMPKELKEEAIHKKDEVVAKIDAIAQKISLKTSLKVDEVKDAFKEYLENTLLAINKSQFKAEEWVKTKFSKSGNTLKKGKEFVDEIKKQSQLMSDELRPGLRNAMDKAINRLHLVRDKELNDLKARVDKLENPVEK